MPEFFIELFSEEIPARMQARAAEDLSRLVADALGPLSPADIRTFYGPRRLALSATLADGVAESRSVERGPRRTAPEQALAGFLRKHNASREQLREEGDFLVLEKVSAGIDAATLIGREMPPLLRRFPWPKSMRWGGTSHFTWVRPLRRIVCLLDGAVVPFDLRDGADDGHGLASSNVTEGHRFLSPGPITVSSCTDWQQKLAARHVIVDAAERRAKVASDVAALAAERQLQVVDDPGLLDEVTGLVEWPVAMLGRIDDAYMDLPPEVMQVSMRVNQRYFALRDAAGNAAPWFAFVANIEAKDCGRAVVAGNERVLRARFSDARHFWDLDRAHTLESRVAALDGVTFHAKLGSQGARVRRLVHLAGVIAPFVGADVAAAQRAALLAKADLTTGMVGEFPELQGVMGRYYALHDGEAPAVADAVRDHYAPKGAADDVPTAPVSVAVALADKIDLLCALFGIGEKPTGSGDPYALRRAALGVIRIILTNKLRLNLARPIAVACEPLEQKPDRIVLIEFLIERLRVKLRGEGGRHDVFSAVVDADFTDDLLRLIGQMEAVAEFLSTDDGANLLAGFRRGANILRIEAAKDGSTPKDPVDEALLEVQEEQSLFVAQRDAREQIGLLLGAEDDRGAMKVLASLRAPLDAFFEKVTVNASDPRLRRNRLALLRDVRRTMENVAQFAKIEG